MFLNYTKRIDTARITSKNINWSGVYENNINMEGLWETDMPIGARPA